MLRLLDAHPSLTAQPIDNPFASLVQKQLEASGQQMLWHLRYGVIRNKKDLSRLLVVCLRPIKTFSFQTTATRISLQLVLNVQKTKIWKMKQQHLLKPHRLFWNYETSSNFRAVILLQKKLEDWATRRTCFGSSLCCEGSSFAQKL